MKVAICTRQRYDDEHVFRRRMELARRTCIPAVIAAAEKLRCQDLARRQAELVDSGPEYSLTWVWRAHKRHRDAIMRALTEEGWTHWISVVDAFGPDGDDVQVALDSDDRIEPQYLRMVADYWRPGFVELRSWQPIKQRLSDGQLFRHRFRYRTKKRVSPFYAIYNPHPELYAYVASHGQLHRLIQPNWRPEPGAIAVIHGANALMDLHRSDVPILKRSAHDYV